MMMVFVCVGFSACGSDDNDDPVKPNPQETSGGDEQKPSQDDSSANEDMLKTPLTLEAIETGTITLKNQAAGPVTYRVNGGEAQAIESKTTEEITVVKGDKVTFFGDNASYGYVGHSRSHIACSAACYIYGNIMSLVTSTNFATANKLEHGNTFSYLFSDNYHKGYIKNHPSYQLMLPATTLADSCYLSMFYGCTGLTKAPKLPSTTLAECCYSRMFEHCEALTEAPELPATTLAEFCYFEMFSYCTKLSSVTCLATVFSDNSCTYRWLYGVSSAGTFTKAKDVEWQTGANGIPEGWTVVER